MQKTGMEIISSEVKAYKSDRSVFHAVLCPGHASQILPSLSNRASAEETPCLRIFGVSRVSNGSPDRPTVFVR